jgi:choline monooxygenase
VDNQSAIFTENELKNMLAPLEHAYAPPAAYYTSQELYQQEVRNIFYKDWLWAGRADQLKKPGDYFAFKVVDEPIVVVRDQSSQLHAFSAVCRHRGAVIASGEGNCRVFTCPYHSWIYSLEGKLTGAPEMNKVPGFKNADYGLTSLKLETWQGNIFVNFDLNSEPLSASLGDFEKYLGNYKLEDLVCTERRVYDFKCNWKMLVENAMEAYHIVGTHRTSSDTPYGQLKYWRAEEPNGLYDVLTFEHNEPLTMNVPGSTDRPQSLIETLTPEEQNKHYFALLYPNMLWILQPDSVVYFVMLPIGHNRVQVICDWAFPKATVEREDFADIAKAAYDGVDGFNQQDQEILDLTYQGYQSRIFSPGRFSQHEPIPHRFARFILNRTVGRGV